MLLTFANIFQPLIDVFEAVLKFFHDSVGVSWGWSIVLLTISVRALLLPLTFKQFHSMQKLQRVAPELKEIQEKYKDDKQRQQQEMMKFYKENKVNPFASCLPLVAQIPVFIALFYMLRTTLRPDICPQTQPHAHLVERPLGGSSGRHDGSVRSAQRRRLPVHPGPDEQGHGRGAGRADRCCTSAAQLASSLLMATPTMDKNQRRIMLLLPLFFVVFVINFPAGLIVYWITTNLWTIVPAVRDHTQGSGPATPAGVAGAAGARRPADSRRPTGRTEPASGSGGGIGGFLGRLRPPDGGKAGERAEVRSATKPSPAARRRRRPRRARRRSARDAGASR